MKKYLVTGAAGFIGSAVSRRLIEQGHKVISIDNLSTGSLDNVPEGVDLYQGDCQDQEIFSKLPQCKYDAIFHIAGQSSGEISFDDPIYDLRTNAESTLLLLKFALQVDCRRFIFASTMSVYGTGKGEAVSESDALNPESFYGVGKIASEKYLSIYEKYGISSTSLRLFNVYGPGQNLDNYRQGMISIFLAQMMRDKKLLIKGSLERFRDFVYIDDVVDSFIICLNKPLTKNNVFNIATGKKTSVAELLSIMADIYGEVPLTIEGCTNGDIFGIYANISSFITATGTSPQVKLKDGLTNFFDSVTKNNN
jgi:UDP-glucose 4-epimerase